MIHKVEKKEGGLFAYQRSDRKCKEIKTLYFEQEKNGRTENKVIHKLLTDIIGRKMHRLSNINSDMLLKEVQSKQGAEFNIKNIILTQVTESSYRFSEKKLRYLQHNLKPINEITHTLSDLP